MRQWGGLFTKNPGLAKCLFASVEYRSLLQAGVNTEKSGRIAITFAGFMVRILGARILRAAILS